MKKIFEYLLGKSRRHDYSFNYEEYDETNPKNSDEYLEGCHTKKFLRASSEYFGNLIDEVRDNPNCTYQTYANELFKDGIVPEYLSVLTKKEDAYKLSPDIEVLSSRICNFMGVPTVYNMKLKKEYCDYLLSVDFLKTGERIESLFDLIVETKGDDLNYNFELDNDNNILSMQLQSLREVISVNKARSGSHAWKFDNKQFFDDYINMFLTRAFVLGDSDFYPRNIASIVDKDNNMKLAPAYDFELSLSKYKYNITSEDRQNIKYVRSRYPKLFQQFCDKYSQLMQKSNLKKLFKDFDDKEFKQESINTLTNCYNSFMRYCTYLDLVGDDEKNKL